MLIIDPVLCPHCGKFDKLDIDLGQTHESCKECGKRYKVIDAHDRAKFEVLKKLKYHA
jgi:uncharacterized protein (DUF983 family)